MKGWVTLCSPCITTGLGTSSPGRKGPSLCQTHPWHLSAGFGAADTQRVPINMYNQQSEVPPRSPPSTTGRGTLDAA